MSLFIELVLIHVHSGGLLVLVPTSDVCDTELEVTELLLHLVAKSEEHRDFLVRSVRFNPWPAIYETRMASVTIDSLLADAHKIDNVYQSAFPQPPQVEPATVLSALRSLRYPVLTADQWVRWVTCLDQRSDSVLELEAAMNQT